MTTTTAARAPDYSSLIGRVEELVADLVSKVTAQVERVAPPAAELPKAWHADGRADSKKPAFEPIRMGLSPAACMTAGSAFAGGVLVSTYAGPHARHLLAIHSSLGACSFAAAIGSHTAMPDLGSPFHQRATVVRQVLSQVIHNLPDEVRAQYADRLAGALTRTEHATEAVVALTAGDLDGAVASARRLT